ncbi:helix-turn-helix domain-containing protein [Nocardia carnea]|uniref:helix-turn-helix domain-containing protein n=1 Tax=Nocardia carnea TaxID=37328 RepID=UPI002454F629|nr:helix-turn-helix domain-containing protein [Nocardia carnea]
MLLHDSDLIAPADRAAALEAAFNDNENPQSVTYVTDRDIRHRMSLIDLGPGVHVLRNTGTGLCVVRNARHVAAGAPDQFAIYMPVRGAGLLTTADGAHLTEAGQVTLIDTARPYTYRQSVHSDNKVVIFDPGLLGLPVDTVRDAAPFLPASPVYPLVRAHFAELCNTPADLPPDAAHAVGQATVQLVRALVTTARDDRQGRAALDDNLAVRVSLYIDAHLHDPLLDPRRIAEAHGVSVRRLYTRWSEAGRDTGIAEWIIRRRLRRAAALLAGSDAEPVVADIARRTGFTNVSHFNRRFRGEYGMAPREYRAVQRAGR